MPWFKIDDKAHSHPKWLKAGNAALGLFVRAGSYSAQHLTEGIVPLVIAQLYGTGPQAAKLVKVGLWHQADHDCPRCPQPTNGDYVIHDFFEGGRNSTRQQVEDARKRATERQSRKRERDNAPKNEDENASNRPRFGGEKSANRDRNEPHFSGSAAGQDGLSQRDALDSVTALHAPAPSSFSPNGEKEAASRQRTMPDQLAELKQAIAAAGIRGVGWALRESQWEHARQAMDRVGIAEMVAYAVNSARLRGVPATAGAWIDGWRSLEAPPQQPNVAYLPAVVNGLPPKPSTTDQRVQAALDLAARFAREDNA